MPRLTEGAKTDDLKLRFDLISPIALKHLAAALTFGAFKYEDWNWSLGIKFSRLFAACLRHMFAWWMGEDIDKEQGLHHLGAAMFCIHCILHLSEVKPEFDDRPKELFASDVGKICDMNFKGNVVASAPRPYRKRTGNEED